MSVLTDPMFFLAPFPYIILVTWCYICPYCQYVPTMCLSSLKCYHIPEVESELNWIGNELIEVCQDPLTGQQLWECNQCDFSCSTRAIIKEHVERHIAGELDSEEANSQDSLSQQGSEQSSSWYQPAY